MNTENIPPTADSGRLPDAPCSAATPETDAMEAADAWQWDDMSPPAPYRRMVDLCRQMERERNSARRCAECIDVWNAALEQPNDQALPQLPDGNGGAQTK